MVNYYIPKKFMGFILVVGWTAFLFNPSGPCCAEQKEAHGFDGRGVLHAMRSDGVVINDIYYALAPDAQYRANDKPNAKKESRQRSMAVGQFVAFRIDAQGRINLIQVIPQVR